MLWRSDVAVVCPQKWVIPEGVKRRQTENQGRGQRLCKGLGRQAGLGPGPGPRSPRTASCFTQEGADVPVATGLTEAAEAQGHT